MRDQSTTDAVLVRLWQSLPTFFTRYAFVIVRNIIGWFFILFSIIAVPLFPGPLGTPLFLIGFTLITFPGKRKITSRILRGRPYDLASRQARILTFIFALVLPPATVWMLARWKYKVIRTTSFGWPARISLYVFAILTAWVIVRGLMLGTNVLVKLAPRVRRKVRPFMHRLGINLLPPRHIKRLRHGRNESTDDEEIIEIDARQVERVRSASRFASRLIKPVVGTIITVAIFYWMLKPVVRQWTQVHAQIERTEPWRFVVAIIMFAIFLFVFRVQSWRYIIMAAGRKLPVAASTRIWSTSELARYLPGVIWQVVGRVFLVKPYGVSAGICSTSQVLELSIFLLANVLVALVSLPWLAGQMEPKAQLLLWIAAGLAPLLLLLLHPKIFYGILNQITRWLGKQPISLRLTGRQLFALVAWAFLGLVWQGMAIWLLIGQKNALSLDIGKIGLVVGAYCLAWCAGFLAFWAPGGLGTREFVLVLTLRFALPPSVRDQFPKGDYTPFLSFLAILLRLWTICGEIIVTSLAYGFDYKGALGSPDAPGRIIQPGEGSPRGFDVLKLPHAGADKQP